MRSGNGPDQPKLVNIMTNAQIRSYAKTHNCSRQEAKEQLNQQAADNKPTPQLFIGTIDPADPLYEGKTIVDFMDDRTFDVFGDAAIFSDGVAVQSTIWFIQHYDELDRDQIKGFIKTTQDMKKRTGNKELPIYILELNIKGSDNFKLNSTSTWRSASPSLLTDCSKMILESVGWGNLTKNIITEF